VPALRPLPAPSHRLRIVAPLNHTAFIRNPEAPPGSAFLPLRIAADSGQDQIVWYVDGRPYRVAGAAETVRWPVEPGRHRFEARPPFGEGGAAPVEITVE
jgi:penicillin-binding protein 1C